MSGGVRDVTVSHSRFIGCGTGIRIKSGRERGGYVTDIRYHDIEIVGTKSAAIMVNAFYGGHPRGCPAIQKYPPPSISNISFDRINGQLSGGNIMQLSGLLDHETVDLSFVNVSFVGNATYNCGGGVRGRYRALTPVPPDACGLVEQN